ncbi:hypothetical protein [Bacillus sp. M6-12]|nr:hypothetical protein [Bacillus sp. M6-12]
MKGSIRIKKKIFTYSFLCKLLGVLSEEDFNRINPNHFQIEEVVR